MISLEDGETRVLVEQTTVVDPERLGRSAGRLGANELRAVDEALMLVPLARDRWAPETLHCAVGLLVCGQEIAGSSPASSQDESPAKRGLSSNPGCISLDSR
jgi:hypothetical protein